MQEREAAQAVTRLWWIFLVTGVLWFVISLVMLRFDETSITTVGVIIGVVFAIACVNELRAMAMVQGWRWLHALLGALFLLVLKGTIDIVEATITMHDNHLWVGFAALFRGIGEIVLAFRIRAEHTHRAT